MGTKLYMTADEFVLRAEEEARYELVEGELCPVAPLSFEHCDVAMEIGARLRMYAREHGLGRAVSEVDFRIAANPDTVRRPDVALVRSERLPAEDRRRSYYEGPPDLAVEVVSPSDSHGAVHEKALSWVRAGVHLVWVVEPLVRIVTVYSPDHAPEVLTVDDLLDGGDVVPGFSLPVRELFE